MAGLLERAVSRLEKIDAVQLQMLMYVFFSRIYMPLAESYRCLEESFKELPPGASDRRSKGSSEAHNGAIKKVSPEMTSWRRPAAGKFEGRPSGELTSCDSARAPPASKRASGFAKWDWRGVPALPTGSHLFNNISTNWMIYVVVRTLFHEQLRLLADLPARFLFNMPGNCLLMGRLVTHPSVTNVSSLLISSFHLIWRLTQNHAKRAYRLTLMLFLWQSEHDIEQFYRLMDANRFGEYLAGPASGLDEVNPVDFEEDKPSKRLLMLLNGKSRLQVGAGPRLHDERPAGLLQVSAEEHLMRHLMCYQVYHRDRVYFKLRPNRTRQARKRLVKRLARASLTGSISLIVLTLIFTVYIALIVLSDVNYVVNYPGCYPALDRLFAEGRLGWIDVTVKNHHLVSLFFDGAENFFIWMDSGIALTFVPTLAYLLNYDLLLYWKHLQQRLELLVAKTRLNNELQRGLFRDQLQSSHLPLSGDQQGRARDRGAANWAQLYRRRPNSTSANLDSNHWTAIKELGRELDLDIHELQFEMLDFFHEVERVDMLVSDILTATILIWLSSCAFTGYNFLVYNKSSVPLVVQFVLALGFLVVAAASYFLLGLRRSCLRSYKDLCSLMANDRTQKKKRYIKLLSFFTQLNRITYTICQRHPYQPTTFITIVGWSFSCFFIAFTLFGGHQLERPPIDPKLHFALPMPTLDSSGAGR